MPRTGPSPADTALLNHLERAGLPTSLAQLERWRFAGALPPNQRVFLGRGRGSRSDLSDGTILVAEALARTTRRGRSIFEAILRVFTADPVLGDLFDDRLSSAIPERGLRSAFGWFVKSGDKTLDRRIERLLGRQSASLDEKADTIIREVRRHHQALRRYGSAGMKYTSQPWRPGPREDDDHAAALAVARHLGVDEIGADRLASVICAGFGRTRSEADSDFSIDPEALGRVLREWEAHGQAEDWSEQWPSICATLELLQRASINDFRNARSKLASIAEMGMMLMQGILDKEQKDRLLTAATASIEANFVFNFALPIADTLASDGWHRMSAGVVLILTDRSDYRPTLDELAAAAVPWRFGGNAEG